MEESNNMLCCYLPGSLLFPFIIFLNLIRREHVKFGLDDIFSLKKFFFVCLLVVSCFIEQINFNHWKQNYIGHIYF